jgi:hypothetical protein
MNRNLDQDIKNFFSFFQWTHGQLIPASVQADIGRRLTTGLQGGDQSTKELMDLVLRHFSLVQGAPKGQQIRLAKDAQKIWGPLFRAADDGNLRGLILQTLDRALAQRAAGPTPASPPHHHVQATASMPTASQPRVTTTPVSLPPMAQTASETLADLEEKAQMHALNTKVREIYNEMINRTLNSKWG